MGLFDVVKSNLASAKYHAKQGLAGIVEATVADSSLPQDRNNKRSGIGIIDSANDYLESIGIDTSYRPAIVDTPGAVANAAMTAGNYITNGRIPLPEKGGYVDEAAARSQVAAERTNAALGIKPPKDASELTARLVGGLVVPIKGAPAINAASKIGKVAQGVRNVAIETALPFRNTPAKSLATAVQIPFGVGVTEAIHATVAPQEGYTGLFESGDKKSKQTLSDLVVGGGAGSSKPKLTLANTVEGPDGSLQMDHFGRNVSTRVGPVTPDGQPDYFGRSAANGIPPIPTEMNPNVVTPPVIKAADEPWTTWQYGAVAFGALAGFNFGRGVIKTTVEKLRGGSSTMAAGDLAGRLTVTPRPVEFSEDTAPWIRKLVPKPVQRTLKAIDQTVAQHDAPIRSAANEFLTPEQSARTGYNLDLSVPQALGAKTKNTMLTGSYSGTTVQGEALAPILQGIATDLTPVERKMLREGLLAATALDDVTASGGKRASFTDADIADLQGKAGALMTDPKLSKYATAIRRQYETLLKFKVESGLITQEAANELRAKRPNYVHLSKDVVRDGGPNITTSSVNTGSDDMLSRNIDDWTGVQVGAARDPIDDLPEQIAKAIHEAEVNSTKKQFLGELANSRGATATVKVSDGSTIPLIKRQDHAFAEGEPGVHKVWENGRPVYYKIGDPSLDNALEFNPRATAGFFGQMRQINQFFTTGLGNVQAMFGATISPVYDTFTGIVFKPQGKDIGLINEMLNIAGVGRGGKVGETIRRFDPTALISAPVGALRSMADELTGAFANSLTTQLIRDNGLVLDLIGQGRTEALRDVLKSRYMSSIRAQMDSMGVSSHFAYGADDASKVPTGLHTIAPDFYRQSLKREAEIAWASMRDGTWSTRAQGAMTISKNGFVQLMNNVPGANTLGKLYEGFARHMQEGFKYQYYATNLPNAPRSVNGQELDALAASTRTIASDPGQYGGGETWNKIADSVMYANVATQAMTGWARRFAKDPSGVIANMTVAMGYYIAFRYGGMVSDPEIRDRVRARTDMQNAQSVIGPGGVEIPIEPSMSPILATTFAFLDAVALDEQGNFDPSFANAIYRYYDQGNVESRNQAAYDAFMAGLERTNPVSPSAIPGVNAVIAMKGGDPSMTRLTGEISPIREQKVDPLGGHGKVTGSMVDAQWGAVIDSTIGSGIMNLINVVDQTQRAMLARNEDGSRGTDFMGALKVGMSQYADKAASSKGPAQSMLFQGYEKVNSVANTDYKLFNGKEKGIAKATQVFGELTNRFMTGSDPRVSLAKPLDLVPKQYAGTQLAVIAAESLPLTRDLDSFNKQGAEIVKAIDEIKSHKVTSIEYRNQEINKLVEQRQHLYSLMLVRTRQAEENINRTLGIEHFTFQNFEQDDFAAPLTPEQNARLDADQAGRPAAQPLPSRQ